ncbi:hypothetical protein [Nocardiopsis ansamitocini]|uniref:hypothetical protein n=1 Tax=Nocardiopsis ansamitocini TaxID=1670832 RepID=UPI0025548FBE|nr:hypothetical protein [Nocardiopsis ansamitocini]
MLPYTAYLRLYQPIVAFSSRDRAYWRAYADSPARPRRVEAMAVEHAQSLVRLSATPPVVAPAKESGDAYVRRIGDELFICPWQTRLRSWLAFESFETQTDERRRGAFITETVAGEVRADFARWRERGEPASPQILTSTWRVPLAWLLPFEADERCLVLGPARGADRDLSFPIPGGTGALGETAPQPAPRHEPRTLLYVAEMADARSRLTRAVSLLGGVAAAGSSLLFAVERLEEWLVELAHPRALLELDYGGLVHLMDDSALRDDHSVAEASAALIGLETGHPELAKAMAGRLRQRWNAVRALRNAN